MRDVWAHDDVGDEEIEETGLRERCNKERRVGQIDKCAEGIVGNGLQKISQDPSEKVHVRVDLGKGSSNL